MPPKAPRRSACMHGCKIANGQPARHQLLHCPKKDEYEIASI